MGEAGGHSTGDFDQDKMISLKVMKAFVIWAGIDRWASWGHLILAGHIWVFFKKIISDFSDPLGWDVLKTLTYQYPLKSQKPSLLLS